MLGENIKFYRKEKKLSQRDLAKDLNVANGTVSQWENGLRTPSLIDIKRIANYFEIDISDLIETKQNKTSIKKNNESDILSLEKKKLIEKIKILNDTQCIRLNAYADRLIEEVEETKRMLNKN